MIVKYRRLYPYAPYLNEEIGYERSIPDDSTDEQMIEAAIKLKEIADKAHQRINPEPLPTQTDYNSGPPSVINLEKERVEILIDNAKSLNDIYEYAKKAEEHGLQDHYVQKLQSLQNK